MRCEFNEPLICNCRDWICNETPPCIAAPDKILGAHYSDKSFFTVKNKIFV